MNIKTVLNLRRASQVLFFVTFLWLVIKTNFEVDFSLAAGQEIILPYPVSIALELDPLAALGTLLATGSLYKGMIWSLLILIPTIFFGRFFCGWVCPMGSLNHWLSEFRSERSSHRGKGKIESNRYKKFQRIKYYILLLFLGSSLTGVLQLGLLDPLSLLARSVGTVVLPMTHVFGAGIVSWIKNIGWPPLGDAAQYVFDFIASFILPYRMGHFQAIISLALFFVAVLWLNRLFTRFWCRAICPLGALLGIFSRFSFLGLKKTESKCDHCQLCVISCQGADNPEIGEPWRKAECHLCLNCQAACPTGALEFTFFPEQEASRTNPAGTEKIDITRRKAMTSIAAGISLFPMFRAGDSFEADIDPKLVRPPGSVDEDTFLARCIRCGQCMRVCPNNALHPTIFEAGLEGIWSPVLISKIGYCEPTCTLCGQVCPTGAIVELTQKQKVGDKETPPNRIGTAFFDRGKCLPWAMATPCIVCEEWCPTSPKAIYLKTEIVTNQSGKEISVKCPYIDPQLCTGCGACEFACPVEDASAVYITSVGESRSEKNQILLKRHSIPNKPANLPKS